MSSARALAATPPSPPALRCRWHGGAAGAAVRCAWTPSCTTGRADGMLPCARPDLRRLRYIGHGRPKPGEHLVDRARAPSHDGAYCADADVGLRSARGVLLPRGSRFVSVTRFSTAANAVPRRARASFDPIDLGGDHAERRLDRAPHLVEVSTASSADMARACRAAIRRTCQAASRRPTPRHAQRARRLSPTTASSKAMGFQARDRPHEVPATRCRLRPRGRA